MIRDWLEFLASKKLMKSFALFDIVWQQNRKITKLKNPYAYSPQLFSDFQIANLLSVC